MGMKSLTKLYLVEMSFQHTIRLIYPSTAALSVASLGTTLQELKITLPSKLSVCEVTQLIPLDCQSKDSVIQLLNLDTKMLHL